MSRRAGGVAVLALRGRGDLPLAALHGRPLHLHALAALVAAGEDVVVAADPDQLATVRRQVADAGLPATVSGGAAWWPQVEAMRPEGLLVHDPLCPLVSADLIREVRRESGEASGSVAAVRPVTDTVKTAADGVVGATLDREGLAAVAAPVHVGAAVLRAALAAGDEPPVHDLAVLVRWLGARGDVRLHRAPSLARRVDDETAVHLLECLDDLDRQTRH